MVRARLPQRPAAYHRQDATATLRDLNNKKITIDGLWALLPGTMTTGGVGTLWFSAGPDDETNGLVGQLIPTNPKKN